MPSNSFDDLPKTPATHFKLYFYAAVLRIIEQVCLSCGSQEAALKQFPFLVDYLNELAGHGLQGLDLSDAVAWWETALCEWERTVPEHLPIQAFAETANLDYATVTLLFATGLVEEDARFGALFETLQGTPGQHRPTIGLLNRWWCEPLNGDVRAAVRRLQELALILVTNPEMPRLGWALQVRGVIWDALCGERQHLPVPWAQYRAPSQLSSHEELILSDQVRQWLEAVPALVTSGQVQTLVVRGPRHNGRRTVLGALAHAMGWGTIEISHAAGTSPAIKPDDEQWQLIGPLATLLHAIPIVVWDLGQGETAEVPPLVGYDGPLGIVLGKHGGVRGAGAEQALSIALDMPDVATRGQHWSCSLDSHLNVDLDAISERFRMTSGNIRRVAQLAPSFAALEGRATISVSDLQQAARAFNRQTLETLATPVTVSGDWGQIVVNAETQRELSLLETRCRYREQLSRNVGAAFVGQLNTGVRVLFVGASGTGKTLAARTLAAVLGMDLYRLDLSSVVNKYIGETEKNLNQLFARAEELDVILLLDEGDALLTQRTDVQTANDRYANLETNYLLQRLESYTGILIVTTNAGDRIDRAFQRRMDVVVEFRPPDRLEQLALWQLHLPASHQVTDTMLFELAHRCQMSGGQIRNAVLHASLLAIQDGRPIASEHLEEAVQREYRKTSAICPLRQMPSFA